MPKINEEEQEKIEKMFSEIMEGNVNILFFSSEESCDFCQDTEDILSEVAELSENIHLETALIGDERATKYQIEMTPATIFVDEDGKDSGVRFYGIPSGYEFNTLIEEIIEISKGKPDIPEDAIKQIKELNGDVKLQVFVTPTCPYCPRAVRVAHQMAMVNPAIQGEMIEATEFQELSEKFGVSGVPKTVINEGDAEQVGAVPLNALLDKIKEII
jgi:glutaredoxin-like protein